VPSLEKVLIYSSIVIGGLLLYSTVRASELRTPGIKLGTTNFDALYRIGDNMNIVWNFSHFGPAEKVTLAFGVAEHTPFGFLPGRTDQKPFQTLIKDVELNDDAEWTDYDIDHRAVLSSVTTLGYYDVVPYVMSEAGVIYDERRIRGVLLALF